MRPRLMSANQIRLRAVSQTGLSPLSTPVSHTASMVASLIADPGSDRATSFDAGEPATEQAGEPDEDRGKYRPDNKRGKDASRIEKIAGGEEHSADTGRTTEQDLGPDREGQRVRQGEGHRGHEVAGR